jgi:phospholipase C
MQKGRLNRRLRDSAVVSATILGLVGAQTGAAFATGYGPNYGDNATATPIKHFIIIIGENRTFDHVFATYTPKNAGDTISNLLSKGIVKANGAPGPNYKAALQSQASEYDSYELAPPSMPYKVLPPAMIGGPATPYGCQAIGVTTGASCDTAANVTAVGKLENGLAPDYLQFLLTGGTAGITYPGPDPRISYDGKTATTLPPGPFQITSAKHPYDVYDASPVHRLFQMWQQLDCDASHAATDNPSGCLANLFPWVETRVGAGSNGKAQPANFTNESTREGSTAMGFYNV